MNDALPTNETLLAPAVSAFVQSVRTPASRAVYAADVRTLLAFLEGQGSALCDVDPALARAYRDRLEADGLAPATRARKLGVARSLYAHLVREGALAKNPFDGIRLPRVDSTVGTTPSLSRSEVERLLGIMDAETPLGLRDRAITYLLFNSGARVSEVARLAIEDLGEEDGIGVARITEKGGFRHRLVLPPYVLSTIRAYTKKAGIESGPIFRIHPANYRHLARTRNLAPDHAITRRSILRMLKKYARRAGIDPTRVRTHSGRVFFITEAHRRTHDLVRVQRAAGHRSITATQRYLRFEEDLSEHPALLVRLSPKVNHGPRDG